MISASINDASFGERMSNREAADYLGLKAATLNKWRCHGGGPPFMKVGRLIRYRRADLDAYLLSRIRLSTSDNGASNISPVPVSRTKSAARSLKHLTKNHSDC